jgi:hypothetical protein
MTGGPAVTILIDAANMLELQSKLREMDIIVPSRTEGRKSSHVERFSIYHLVATLALSNRLEFPLSVIRHERPDFLIRMADRHVGVEITEATDQQYAKYLALAEREFPDAILEPALFTPDSPPRTNQELREFLQQRELSTDGWRGNQVERYWAQYVLRAIDGKLGKLGKSGFGQFDLNWLTIYDNTPTAMLNMPEAIGLLQPELEGRWQLTPAFDAVFVESGRDTVEFTRTGSTLHTLNDLWA